MTVPPRLGFHTLPEGVPEGPGRRSACRRGPPLSTVTSWSRGLVITLRSRTFLPLRTSLVLHKETSTPTTRTEDRDVQRRDTLESRSGSSPSQVSVTRGALLAKFPVPKKRGEPKTRNVPGTESGTRLLVRSELVVLRSFGLTRSTHVLMREDVLSLSQSLCILV